VLGVRRLTTCAGEGKIPLNGNDPHGDEHKRLKALEIGVQELKAGMFGNPDDRFDAAAAADPSIPLSKGLLKDVRYLVEKSDNGAKGDSLAIPQFILTSLGFILTSLGVFIALANQVASNNVAVMVPYKKVLDVFEIHVLDPVFKAFGLM
jgi:hypothetical protein